MTFQAMPANPVGNHQIEKKILARRGKFCQGNGGMRKNSWIAPFFTLFLALCAIANGVVIGLQRVSQIHESGRFFQQMALFFQVPVFRSPPLSFPFFLYYREKKKKGGGEDPKRPIHESGQKIHESKKQHPRVGPRKMPDYWMGMGTVFNEINNLRSIQQSMSFFAPVPGQEVRND